MTMEDPSLTALGYQLLPLATSQLMGDNREFDLSGKFWSDFFSRTNGHQARPIFVIFHNGRRWNFDFHWHRWIPWPKIVGVINSHFFSGTNGHQARPFFFIMAEGEILISVDTDGFLDPKLWGVINSHFFSRTNGHQATPIFVIFHNDWRWNFDFHRHRWIPWPNIWGGGGALICTFSLGPTDTKLDPFLWFFIMTEGELLIFIDTDGFLNPKLWAVINSHFFSRTKRHQSTPIFVIFHNGRRWNFDFRWCWCPRHMWWTTNLYMRGHRACDELLSCMWEASRPHGNSLFQTAAIFDNSRWLPFMRSNILLLTPRHLYLNLKFSEFSQVRRPATLSPPPRRIPIH